MKAFVEVLAGVIRVGSGAAEYGDPYEFSVAFSADAGVATVKGLALHHRKFTRADHRAIIAALKAAGLTRKRDRNP